LFSYALRSPGKPGRLFGVFLEKKLTSDNS
jgi:hypothetical protein